MNEAETIARLEAELEASKRREARQADALKSLNEKYRNTVIAGNFGKAAAAAGVLPEAVSDLIAAAKASGWGVDDNGDPVLTDPKTGRIVYGPHGDPVSPEAWVFEQKNGARRYLFGNGQVQSSAQGSFGGERNPWSKEHWHSTDQARVYLESPERAKAMAAAAGSRIGALRPT